MNKEYADKITTEYMEKIFGFALSKTMKIDKAEELASRIIFDLYISLLKIDDVYNIDGYVYRVASNVYARFVDEEVKSRYISLGEMNLPSESDFTSGFERDETYNRLRREISYLGKMQREIIVMHYFQGLKLNEIAGRLNIPLGTVKWHLFDARSQIKEGMRMRETGTLGMKPVRINHFGFGGTLGPIGKEPEYYFSKLISQNIAYAAYHEAKTITEIAEQLGVSAAYVEDEAACLEDIGFMNKAAGGKYLTNFLMMRQSKEVLERKHELNKKYAKIVRDVYVPLIFDYMKDYKVKKIYTPQDDFNFLMWSAVTYACIHKFFFRDADKSKYYVKYKDGTVSLTTAWIIDAASLSYDYNLYRVPVCFSPNKVEPVHSWQVYTYYDSRDKENFNTDNLHTDYCWLYDFMTGKLTKDIAHADKFKRLFDKGYIVTKGGAEYVNMVVAAMSYQELTAALPAVPDEIKTANDEHGRELYEIEKAQCPPHWQELLCLWCVNPFGHTHFVTYILELLVADGTLKPLTDVQKHSVNTIMFCDTLPE